jgi:hypothetical protein
MFLASSNRSRQLLLVQYFGRTQAAELHRGLADIQLLLEELPAGFGLLVDLSRSESMDLDCVPEIARMMELIGRAGVGTVVRVIPDPRKDIGLNILSVFHYPHHPRIITCQSLTEAGRHLSL